jgi:site-specific DNA-methyltransferase (adenine-specific)
MGGIALRPYFDEGGVTIYCGRFEDVMDGIGEVDAVITDPPYGETSLEWDVWPAGWPSLVAKVTRCLWCFGSMRMFLDKRDEFVAGGWKFAQDIVWEKHNGSGLHDDRFRRVHERAIEFDQGPEEEGPVSALQYFRGAWGEVHKEPPLMVVPEEERRSGTLRRKSKPSHFGGVANEHAGYEYGGTRLMRSVMKVRSCHGRAINETQKPEGIVEPLVGYSVPPGGVVLDVFAGSGTTGVVARRMGRRAILVEKRESQCEAMVERLRGELF